MSALVTGICLLMIVYMVYRIIVLLKRNKANKKLISLVNSFNDEQAFFAKCEELTGVADPEMAAKAFVIQFWGAVRAKKYDLAAQALERLKIGDLLPAKEKDAVRMGIETKEIQGIKHDFLRIIYRGNAELLVPLDQFRLVRKFVSREGVVPKLSKLGSDEWQKTKERLETDVRDLAERLVKLYSARGESIGYAFHEVNRESNRYLYY